MQKIRNITALFLLAFFALLQADNANAKVTFERDNLGRVLKEISNGVEVASTYNMQGQREKITSTLGADITAAYNPLGDLLTLSSGEWSTQYRRDLFGLETDRNLGNGISVSTERDCLGRVTDRKTKQGFLYLDQKEYFWSTNNKLSSIVDNGKHTFFEYDKWGNLAKTTRHEDKQVEYRTPDKMGNLYETEDRSDRRYARGGQLQCTQDWTFKYDDEGFLIEKRHRKHVQQAWLYKWNGAGMLEQVTRPDGVQIRYWYDALGRRIQKRVGTAKTTKYLWDGNVILHEQTNNEPIVTWIFEEGTFKPTGKIVGEENYQIVTNYMGTPDTMYDSTGKEVWSCELNSYGAVRKIYGKKDDCPFRYQGQYEDSDTGLSYNRFRYYDSTIGNYISQDPIGLAGGNPTLYGYVEDTNSWIDAYGLISNSAILTTELGGKQAGHDAHHIVMAGSNDTRMKALRKKMDRFKININSKENGIMLPRTNDYKIDSRTAHHGEGLHSDSYKKYVYDKLIGSKNKTEFLQNLKELKKELKNGKTFPCKK